MLTIPVVTCIIDVRGACVCKAQQAYHRSVCLVGFRMWFLSQHTSNMPCEWQATSSGSEHARHHQTEKKLSLFFPPKERNATRLSQRVNARTLLAPALCVRLIQQRRVSDRYDGLYRQYRFSVWSEQYVSHSKHFKQSGFVSVFRVDSLVLQPTCKRVAKEILNWCSVKSECDH